jgi:hypothetical protein
MSIQPAAGSLSVVACDRVGEGWRSVNVHLDTPHANKRRLSSDEPRQVARGTRVAALPEHSRPKRGGALRTCAGSSPFRECRGGESLESFAWFYDPFDQVDYSSHQVMDGRGTCEGWVREALRRLDRSEGVPNLSASVREMRTDANTRRDNIANDMFTRVDSFQSNEATLALRRYEVGTRVQFSSDTRSVDVRPMFRSMWHNLGVNGLAHIRLGVVSRGTVDGRTGHALLVQHLPNEQYAIFDPNNGAFLYPDQRHMNVALTDYIERAFEGTGMELRPDSIQYYGLPAPGSANAEQGWTAPPVQPLREPIPAIPRAEPPMLGVYQRTADISNRLSSDVLSAAAGQRDAMSDADRGLTLYALTDIAQSRSSSLMEATENVRQRLSDEKRRASLVGEIARMQEQNRHGFVGEIDGYIRHEGASGLRTADNLIGDLKERFGNAYVGDDPFVQHLDDFAIVSIAFHGRPGGDSGNAGRRDRQETEGHSIVIQRLHPSALFTSDEYEIYDSNSGVFRYANFGEMSNALRGLYRVGYGEFGGIDHTDTTYYANSGVRTGTSSSTGSEVANLDLDAVERGLGIGGSPSMTPPRADLPPPDFVQPAPYSAHSEFKRSTDLLGKRKPDQLFRPSTVSPDELRKQGGFDSGRTKLPGINLNLHNFDVAANPRLIDSAGYLGTFRSEQTALSRLPSESGDGYIYFVAPTPNMIDVNGSLGSGARASRANEVAAMGWIDYPQIRGWRVVNKGVPGEFIGSPDYRWDVYNQTQTAGTQLQLSRFPIGHAIWREKKYNSYVSEPGGANRYRKFNEDPSAAHAKFYDNAWQKVRDLNTRQTSGRDYRGPLQIQAYNGTDSSNTLIHLDSQGNVIVSSMSSWFPRQPGSKDTFMMGEDGRFHLAGDLKKVLRVGSDGYVYMGDIPDSASVNGVFEYDGNHHLIHQEDHKFLVAGVSVYTPFVDRVEHGVRSQWKLQKGDHTPIVPPGANQHTFNKLSAGSPSQLYAFYNDPDTALPETATSFVTGVPENPHRGNFLDYVSRIAPVEARDAASRLRSQNAAWLFKDGYYAVSEQPGELVVRKLDGTPVWQAEGLDAGWGNVRFTRLTEQLSSNYQIRPETWQRVEESARRRARVLAS